MTRKLPGPYEKEKKKPQNYVKTHNKGIMLIGHLKEVTGKRRKAASAPKHRYIFILNLKPAICFFFLSFLLQRGNLSSVHDGRGNIILTIV